MLQSFYRMAMTVDYYLNLPEYLAKCININKPELHCDGQCFLMQKMEEAGKQESKSNLLINEYNTLYVLKDYIVFSMEQLAKDYTNNLYTPYTVAYIYNYYHTIFKPPVA